MAHGLADTKSAWDRCVVELRHMEDAGRYVFLQSAVNARWRTHHGLDVCGRRLAQEIRGVLAEHPGLKYISMIGHSMGGMIVRYAAGLLYRPADGTIGGLAPRHFVTLASPHLGLTVDCGPAQVPFVAWAGELPLLGGALQRGLQAIGHGVASRLFSGTGRHFLALDGGPGELPLLMRMTLDEPDKGCYFLSALRAFSSRACYGNIRGDHWVSWQNATLRDTHQLPHLEPELVRRGRGVVREDPPQAAWSSPSPSTGGEAGSSSGAGGGGGRGAAAGCGGEAGSSGGDGGGCGSGEGGGGRAEASAVGSASRTDVEAGKGIDVQRQAAAGAAQVPAATAGSEQQRAGVGGGEGDGGAGVGAGAAGAPAAKAAASVSSPAASAAPAAAGSAAAAAATAAGEAQAVADAEDVALEDALTATPESPDQVVSFALGRLQSMPWRRVDCSFAGARMGTAHNNIQATRWTNTVGAGVLRHLRMHLEAMEQHAREVQGPGPTPGRA